MRKNLGTPEGTRTHDRRAVEVLSRELATRRLAASSPEQEHDAEMLAWRPSLGP